MADKQLKDKAIKIQGKDYVLVSDRVLYFNETYPNGCIETQIVKYEAGKVIVKAIITPNVLDRYRQFNAFSQEKEGEGFINKTSALENAETSAIGRALALMGIGVIDSIASVDEITKAKNREKTTSKTPVKEESKEDYLTRLKKHIIEKLPDATKKLPKEEIMDEADRYIEREIGQPIKIKDLDEPGAKKLYFDLLNKNGKANS